MSARACPPRAVSCPARTRAPTRAGRSSRPRTRGASCFPSCRRSRAGSRLRSGGLPWTTAPSGWSCESASVSTTLGFGLGGFMSRHRGDDSNLLVRRARVDLDPVAFASPLRFASLIPVAPAAAAALSDVFVTVGSGLEAVRDHVAVVPVLVGAVARRRVEHVRDRPRPLGQDHRVPVLLDPVQDPVAATKKYFSTPMFACTASPSPAIRKVGAPAPMK